MDVVGPLVLQSQVLDVGLPCCLGGDMVGHEEARQAEVEASPAFASAGFEHPVVRVEAVAGNMLEEDVAAEVLV